LTLYSNGAFVYTPNAGYTGDDTFSYHAFDGMEFGNVATVTIHQGTDPNGPPVGQNDVYTVTHGQTLAVAAGGGVLSNDSDSGNDLLTAVLVTNTAHGILTLYSNGAFVYTPNAGFVGVDNFTYKDFDGIEYGNVSTVTINVV
jgi:VCBS repeat-containing protein